jgi:hypothetical protein
MLTNTCKTRLLQSILADIGTITVADNTTVTIATTLSLLTVNAHPLTFAISWGTVVNGAVSTLNRAENSNAINFSMKISSSPKWIVLYKSAATYPSIVIACPTPIPSYLTRGAYYIDSLNFSITEA